MRVSSTSPSDSLNVPLLGGATLSHCNDDLPETPGHTDVASLDKYLRELGVPRALGTDESGRVLIGWDYRDTELIVGAAEPWFAGAIVSLLTRRLLGAT
jgi:hypothetical protein